MSIEGPIIANRSVELSDVERPALVGPHAVIHAVDVMRECLDSRTYAQVLADAQLERVPSGLDMIPEIDVIRLHRWLATHEPVACFPIAEEAARRTADYIIANRIPKLATALLRILPTSLSAILLMKAIRRHAWTFIGAGRFDPCGGWRFTIDRTQANDAVIPPATLFRWYAGVFETLYRRLISPGCRCSFRPIRGRESCTGDYLIRPNLT
ncbi:bacteriochlorophyll 4-vinyl reductase [Erythrobacter sp. YT30]|uniref:bacteriochlorophyll 4-vinyl reductase n=1 Tax=Erythrobacter sp. YT30 TaxID=1735012 RepID=UPI00076C9B59|nr:hypothetical protein AUC45_06990 [Erythrobacter sp. YT30]